MSNRQEFNDWFEAQKAKGLASFRISLPLGELTEDMMEQIRQDILLSEKAIAEGRLGKPPEPSPMSEEDIRVHRILSESKLPLTPAEISAKTVKGSGYDAEDFHHMDKEILETLQEQLDKDPNMSESHAGTIHLFAARIGKHYGMVEYPPGEGGDRFSETRSLLNFVDEMVDKAISKTMSRYTGMTE